MCVKWAVGGILSAGYDHCIREWDVETGVNTNTMVGTYCVVSLFLSMVFLTGQNGSKVFLSIDESCDSHMIASGHTDRHVRLWDTRASSEGE